MAKGPKVRKLPTTGSERWQHLQEQIGFLQRSCRDFDKGHHSEAKRMANEVIKLVFDKGSSFRSVLGQVGMLPGMGFISTKEIGGLLPGSSLVLIRVGNTGAQYEAPTDKIPANEFRRPRVLTFESWWNEVVVTRTDGREHPRWEIVRSLRDQQGGGHVDEELDPGMAELLRDNPIGITWSRNKQEQEALRDVELHTMRQIAHEVLISIDRKLRQG